MRFPSFAIFLLIFAASFGGCDSSETQENNGAAPAEPASGAGETDALDDPELQSRLSRIQSIGYVAGVQPAEGLADAVTRHDPEQAWPGFNLHISFGKSEAQLLDMEGRTVHAWRKPLADVWRVETLLNSSRLKRWVPQSAGDLEKKDSWHRGFLMPDGGMIAMYKDVGLVALDRNSNTLWRRILGAHHDLDRAGDGRLFVIFSEARVLPRIHPDEPQLDDLIAVLTPEGEELRRLSIHDALAASPFAHLLDRAVPDGDPFHTNSIQILKSIPQTDPPLPGAFRPGSLLVSIREINTVGLIDPETEAFTWVKTGPWKEQHDARLAESGVITLFDNLGGNFALGQSRALDYDPVRDRVVWEYDGEDERPLYSRYRGNMQRLPNGNSLITESDAGRVLEVTPEGRVVWEFINPQRTGEKGETIAAIRRFERVDPAGVESWLEGESP